MEGAVSLRAACSRDEGGSLAWLLQRQETEKQEGSVVGCEGWEIPAYPVPTVPGPESDSLRTPLLTQQPREGLALGLILRSWKLGSESLMPRLSWVIFQT